MSYHMNFSRNGVRKIPMYHWWHDSSFANKCIPTIRTFWFTYMVKSNHTCYQNIIKRIFILREKNCLIWYVCRKKNVWLFDCVFEKKRFAQLMLEERKKITQEGKNLAPLLPPTSPPKKISNGPPLPYELRLRLCSRLCFLGKTSTGVHQISKKE